MILSDFLDRLYPPLNLIITGVAKDTAIEQTSIAFFADQNSGKTNTCLWIAAQAEQRYSKSKVQVHYSRGGDFKNLLQQEWRRVPVHILIADDLTSVPDRELETTVPQLFQIRHVMQEKTGLNEGLIVMIFVGHIFHQINKAFRATDYYLFRDLPNNDYDYRVVEGYIGGEAAKILQESKEQRLTDKTRRGDTFIVYKRRRLGMVRFPKYEKEPTTINAKIKQHLEAIRSTSTFTPKIPKIAPHTMTNLMIGLASKVGKHQNTPVAEQQRRKRWSITDGVICTSLAIIGFAVTLWAAKTGAPIELLAFLAGCSGLLLWSVYKYFFKSPL